ncbi:uncharacterized protein LOC134279594 [Saccostrea cucullata]|uniref:uncharacterized protein LOC134279594 n=1 Tax=Saccostrea cuccullata TaxID=36930 RepID=UPI002ED1AF63
MAVSLYASTEETTNRNRVCRLILGPCTHQLQDQNRVAPHNFSFTIKMCIKNLPRLTVAQRNIILPSTGTYTGNYTDFDISLLYILLRKISSIPPHTNSWGNDPHPSDKSLSANIEWIRIYRNECAHSTATALSNTEFTLIWSKIKDIVIELDGYLNNSRKYELEVDFLRHETMDPTLSKSFHDQLQKQAIEDQMTREIVERLEKQMKKNMQSISHNVRVLQEIEIQNWEVEDAMFHENHNFPNVWKKVTSIPFTVLTGIPGSGKSATARHIALKLQRRGYELVPVTEIREIYVYYNVQKAQVFVVDDVVGIFGMQKNKFHELIDYEKIIKNPHNSKTMVLTTCRLSVFNELLCMKSFITTDSNVINLDDEENSLTADDKIKMLIKHNITPFPTEALSKTSPMFPFLCKLYSTDNRIQQLGISFFKRPLKCLFSEIEKMKLHNGLQYCALVLCMLCNNRLSRQILDNAQTLPQSSRKIIFKNCDIAVSTDHDQIEKALRRMEGTYTTKSTDYFKFIHYSIFEVVAYSYGKSFPEHILQFLSCGYLMAKVAICPGKPKQPNHLPGNFKGTEQACKLCMKENEIGTKETLDKEWRVLLHSDMIPALAKRFYKEIKSLELYDVFSCKTLKNAQVAEAFTTLLQQKTYQEIKSVFLAKQTDLGKLLSPREISFQDKQEFV